MRMGGRPGAGPRPANLLAERLRARGEDMLRAARALAAALRSRGARDLILFGSLARGPDAVGPTSDVDLAVVMPGVGAERMHRRLTDLPEVLDFPYPLDLFVFTPEEWQQASQTWFVAHEIISGGLVLGG